MDDQVDRLLDDIITEDKTFEQQLDIIKRRIAAAKKPQAEVMMITPGLAKWFTTNGHFIQNRQLRNEKIAHYGQAMREPGGWAMTGQPIIFELGEGLGGEGRLLDGYHRCRACMITKKPFVTLVVFGIEASSFKLIDTGTVRTAGDAFRIADIPNAATVAMATRWIKIYSTRNRFDRGMRWENIEAIAYHDTLNKSLLQQMVPDARRIAKASGRLLPKSQTLAYLYVMYERPRHRAVLQTFIDHLSEGRSAGKAIFKYLDGRRANGVRIHENMRTVVLDAARDALLQKQNLTQRMLADAVCQYMDTQADREAADDE